MSKLSDHPPLVPAGDAPPHGYEAALNPTPPPYTEREPGTTEKAPGYEARRFARRSTNESKTLQAATIKFPPAINGYINWKAPTTFHLGPSAEEKLYAVSTHATLFNDKPSIVLYDGPTTKHPIMATVKGDRWGRSKPFAITIPPRPGAPHQDAIVEQMIGTISFNNLSAAFTFGVNLTGKEANRERFEWRNSHGKEIKELAGHTNGWKLVRLSGPVSSSAGRSRKQRDLGFTSDGLEIVAVVAQNTSLSFTKGFRFAFMGSGLTGTMGENWEIIAVASALQLWYSGLQGASTTTTTAVANMT